MKQYETSHIKNIALAGHGGKGKTTLAEAMLYLSGGTDRLGRVADGNTVMDFDAEERKRGVSLSTAVAPVEWGGLKLNIIDTPGLFDFAGGLCEGMRAAGTSVIVVSGKSGCSVGDEKAYAAADRQKAAKFFFISKMDSEHADFQKTLDSLTAAFGQQICPVVVPLVENHAVKAYVNLLTGKQLTYQNGKATESDADLSAYQAYVDQLQEAVAMTNEEMMEKFFAGEPFTRDEIVAGISQAIKNSELAPVYCGSGYTLEGVDQLLNGIAAFAPAASERSNEPGEKEGETLQLKADPNGPLVAIVFKTIADPQVGKRSFFKVISGTMKADSQVVNARTGAAERVSKLYTIKGARFDETASLCAGDIGAVAKLSTVMTGDTLCQPGNVIVARPLEFPAACYSLCIKPKNRGDEDKIVNGLNRLIEEDPTISQASNAETHEQILSGLGEQHLDVVVAKLKSKFGVDVLLSPPTVAYRETIRKKVEVQGRHKKQSGGHGQFGDVWIRFEPCESDELVFEEEVFGGSVPRNFFPAVEKGLRECMQKGVLAGYPVVGVKATLYDGSYHPVDSSEMSFKTAASIAFRNGIAAANPTILEPIGALKVTVPGDNMGDVMGDVTKRRGRVLGMNPTEGGQQLIEAEVPMAEMSDFATVLRSVTQGRGSFSLTFERYEEAPQPVVEKVVAEAKAKAEE